MLYLQKVRYTFFKSSKTSHRPIKNMCKHHIVYYGKTRTHHVHIINFNCLLIYTTNYLLIYRDIGEVANNILPKIIETNIIKKIKFISSPSLVYLGCTPPWCINSPNLGWSQQFNKDVQNICYAG